MSKSSGLLKGAAISLAATVATLLLCEVALARFQPIYTSGIQDAYEYDSVLGVRLRSSIDLVRVTDHREEIHSNALGTANFEENFSGYSQLVFALGDSYTQGIGVPQDASYPAQLNVLLNTNEAGVSTKKFAVVNLGLAAFGAEQSLRTLSRYRARLGKPSLCLYLGSDNDYDDDLLFRSGSRHNHLVRNSPRWGPLAPSLIWLGNRQIALRAKLAVANWKLARLRRAQVPAGNPQVSPSSEQTSRSVAEIEWPVIERIVNLCKQDGGRTIIAWSRVPDASPSYNWIADKSRTEGIPFNDWYARVQSIRAANPALPLYNTHSAGHYRPWVNTQIAKGFAMIIDSLAGSSPDGSKSPR